MRSNLSILTVSLVCLLFICPLSSQAQQPGGENAPRDVLSEHFFTADLILNNADLIELSDEQATSVKSITAAMKKKIPVVEAELKSQMDALGKKLEGTTVDQEIVLKQLDNVLKQERQIKRVHLISLMKIRETLTAKQQSSLKSIRADMVKDQQAMQQRIQAKAMKINQAAQQMMQSGQQPTALIQALQEFQQKARAGDIAGAEAALDRGISQLDAATQPQGFQLQGTP